MTRPRWGIMGTGGIAAAMAGTLRAAGSELAAVGSASPVRARSFAQEWQIPHSVSPHDAVAEIDDVDVVYVATTNDRHLEDVLACLRAGKAVLCEKPIAINAGQARKMFAAAHEAEAFLMEAMWMRFLPHLSRLDDLVAAGTIGDVGHVQAVFSHPAPQDPARRWASNELGGGSLLDLGIYSLSLIHHLLGPPRSFEAQSWIGPTGVDLETSVISRHAAGASASATSSFVADLTNEAVVSGTKGRIRLHSPFHHTRRLTIERRGRVVQSVDTTYEGHGFRFEVAETERCLAAGLIESPRRAHATTLALMEWMDAVRARCGIAYAVDAP